MTALKIRGKFDDGAGLSRMVILSFLLHALCLSIFFLSPSLPARKWTFGPVYNVDLVSLPAGYLEKKMTTPMSREVASIGAGKRAEALKKTSIAPIKRLAPIKKESGREELERAIEGVRTRVAAERRAPAARQEMAETSGVMNTYYETLWSRIKSEWALPPGILASQELEAVVDVTVSRSGSVTSLSLEKSSGNRYFDQSALRAIRKASPFPPIPESIRGSSIDLGIRFHTAEFR